MSDHVLCNAKLIYVSGMKHPNHSFVGSGVSLLANLLPAASLTLWQKQGLMLP